MSGVFHSDHSVIQLSLNYNEQERGPGVWKLNTTHLTNKQLIKLLKENIEIAISSNVNRAPDTKWERLKGEIFQTSINGLNNEQSKEMLR